MNQEIILTSISKGSGCGCKIQPSVLQEMLQGLNVDLAKYNQLLVGNHLNDDCSVYDLGDGQLLLQTVDFFTPMVNDATIFGRTAAANALSDIYAMGGRPIMANAVFSWPLDILPVAMGREVLKGGMDLAGELGVPVAGGHSIDGKEPIFGLSVTGLVLKSNLKTNADAQIHDTIYMTKPLGIRGVKRARRAGPYSGGAAMMKRMRRSPALTSSMAPHCTGSAAASAGVCAEVTVSGPTAALGAVLHLVPDLFPLLPPGEGAAADRAGLGG